MACTFNTTFMTELKLKLPELNQTTEITEKCHLTKYLLSYDLILEIDIVLC